MDVDIVTGMPLGLIEAEKKEIEKSFLRKDLDVASAMVKALKSKTGLIFQKQCEEILFQRIEAFVKSDPGAQAILQVLNSIGIKIDAARVASEKLLREQLRQSEGRD